MAEPDIRWVQRLASFRRALQRLQDAVAVANTRPLSDLEEQGLIKAFEFSWEFAWNVLKDYLTWQGFTELYGSRSALRTALQVGLLESGELWMEMLEARNLSSHVYDETTAHTLAQAVADRYLASLTTLAERLEKIRRGETATHG